MRRKLPFMRRDLVIALAVVFVGLGSSHMMVLGRAAKFSGIITAKLRHALITHLEASKGYGRDTSLQESARFNHP